MLGNNNVLYCHINDNKLHFLIIISLWFKLIKLTLTYGHKLLLLDIPKITKFKQALLIN